MQRRQFITLSSLSMLAPFEDFAGSFQAPAIVGSGFSLKILATNWGFTGATDEFCAKAKSEGYDGVELWWDFNETSRKALFESLQKHGLSIGFLCGSYESAYDPHFANFKKGIDAASASSVKPLYINCHSGKDYFSYAQNKTFIDYTTEANKKTGVPIYHETHRSRMLFAAHVGRDFMEKNPALQLTFDVSHWCNVAETLLHDQPEALKLAVERTGHIHARIGHEEGPQVNDPRAPEWERAVKTHLAWWDAIVERKMKAGEPLTILTEFGPPNYLPTLPYTKQPLANQWDINVYMMQMLRKRYLK